MCFCFILNFESNQNLIFLSESEGLGRAANGLVRLLVDRVAGVGDVVQHGVQRSFRRVRHRAVDGREHQRLVERDERFRPILILRGCDDGCPIALRSVLFSNQAPCLILEMH